MHASNYFDCLHSFLRNWRSRIHINANLKNEFKISCLEEIQNHIRNHHFPLNIIIYMLILQLLFRINSDWKTCPFPRRLTYAIFEEQTTLLNQRYALDGYITFSTYWNERVSFPSFAFLNGNDAIHIFHLIRTQIWTEKEEFDWNSLNFNFNLQWMQTTRIAKFTSRFVPDLF